MADAITSLPRDNHAHREVELLRRENLSDKTIEIELSRPKDFQFSAGQTLSITAGGVERYYSLVSTPDDPAITLCVRHIPHGTLSPILASAPVGTRFSINGPHGYFTFRPSPRPAVFVATGSGIAPFVSMTKSGAAPFALLHGVRRAQDLYYRSHLSSHAEIYVPCLSQPPAAQLAKAGVFSGWVTAYVEKHLQPGSYDFYLCGNQNMIRDLTLLVDKRFPGSYVFTEIFF